MIKSFFFLLSSLVMITVPTCKVDEVISDSQPVTHEAWDGLLKQYVSPEGWVDYEAWRQDTASLVDYVDMLSGHYPNDKNWTRNQQLAYWINSYNAHAILIVLRNWPTQSITAIEAPGLSVGADVWGIQFIQVEGEKYSLNNLEHGIIRPKFEEQLTHVAVNCASVSCPQLRDEAYTADKLQAQLEDQARKTLASFRCDLSDPNNPKVSSIFKWYAKDFKWNGSSLSKFVEKYSDVDLPKGVSFTYLEYDWNLNSQANNLK